MVREEWEALLSLTSQLGKAVPVVPLHLQESRPPSLSSGPLYLFYLFLCWWMILLALSFPLGHGGDRPGHAVVPRGVLHHDVEGGVDKVKKCFIESACSDARLHPKLPSSPLRYLHLPGQQQDDHTAGGGDGLHCLSPSPPHC